MKPPIALLFFLTSCARVDLYYPPDGKSVVVDDRGRAHRAHNRALVLNGTDSLGNTVIDVSRNGVRLASAGGLDNSTATKEGYRTIRFGIASAAWAAGAVGVANVAANAYGSNQAAAATSNAAASKAAAATAASKGATTVRLAEIQARAAAQATRAATAVPAAGSVIPATIPSTVVPIVAP